MTSPAKLQQEVDVVLAKSSKVHCLLMVRLVLPKALTEREQMEIKMHLHCEQIPLLKGQESRKIQNN